MGIAWQGNPRYKWDAHRSIPLAAFAPLAHMPRVRLISLQKGPGAEQIRSVNVEVIDFGTKLDKEAAFVDTAALMQSLDLVITSDTAIAHLAGALGAPAWVALKQVPDWRWMMDRADSPWYPSIRLFRQSARNDWNGVFADIERELRVLVGNPPAP